MTARIEASLGRDASAPNGRRARRLLGISLIAASAALAVFAGIAVAAPGRGHALPVLTIIDTETPVSLDPAKDYTTFDQWRSLSNESILHVNPNGTYGSGLAVSWHFYTTGRGNNKDFEFTLRHNARFSDGTPVTAQAVVTWMKYFESQTGLFQPQMGPIRSINASGKWTVQIHLNTPNPLVPYLLSEVGNWGAVESPKAVADPSKLSSGTYGAGPYMLDSSQTVTNSQYTFVPNPYYYNKKAVHWSKVIVKIILANPSAVLDAIRTGQAQLVAGDITTADAAAGSGLTVYSVGNGDGGLAFSDRNGRLVKALADPRFRQALNYAVDRPTICRALYGKWGGPATSGMPATDATLPTGYKYPYTYNVAKAKSLLAAAGYANGGGLTMKMLAYAPLGIDGTEMPQAIAKYFQAVGINLDVTTATSAGQYVSDRSTLQFPVESNTLGIRPLFQDYNFVYNPNGTLNPFHNDDPTLDKLYVAALHSKTPSTDMDQMAERITSQAYTLNVCTKPRLWYATKSIGGVALNGITTAPLATGLFPK